MDCVWGGRSVGSQGNGERLDAPRSRPSQQTPSESLQKYDPRFECTSAVRCLVSLAAVRSADPRDEIWSPVARRCSRAPSPTSPSAARGRRVLFPSLFARRNALTLPTRRLRRKPRPVDSRRPSGAAGTALEPMHSQGAAESGFVDSAKETPRAIRGDSGSSWRRLPLLLARLERDDLPTDNFLDKRLRKDAPDGDAAALLVLLLKGFERSKAGGVTGGVVPEPVAKRPSSRRRGDGGIANVTAVDQEEAKRVKSVSRQVSVAMRGHAADVRRLEPGCACVCTLKCIVVGDRIAS
jgi:hypothetical protein